jgi:predicted AlkP superfamily phosphohydrolase/phosphomutase
MGKVLIMGLDGMDSHLISKYKDYMPNTIKMITDGKQLKLKTVFPPDSDTSWASIYTGLNPAKHGVLQFIDALEKTHKYLSEEIDNTNIRGKTYWDIAGEHGKKVCILLPHIGYPVWSVNGIMIGRSSKKEHIMAFPPEIAENNDLSNLNTIKKFPGRNKFTDEYINSHLQLVKDSMEFGLEMYQKGEWDIFFLYSSALDVVPHFFWNCCDENDPTYIDDNPHKNLIQDLYALHDEYIGKFMEIMDDETVFIVHSDHGHGMRPIKIVNINEILKKNNLLFPKEGHAKVSLKILDKIKFKMLDFVGRNDLENVAAKLLRSFPLARKIYISPPSIDWDRTVAYTCDLSGIKAYSYGGIKINNELVQDESEYNSICDNIINCLNKVEDPVTGEKIVNWALKKENLYEGEYLFKYPDILFQLDEKYGAGWGINVPLFSKSPSHNINPGSHKGESAVFLMYNCPNNINKQFLSLMDIAPTVLDILGIELNLNIDGNSIMVEFK